MNKMPPLNRRGQILPGAIAMLVILAVMIPAIVLWVQRETVFASKQSYNTVAFHLAEAGVEKAYLYITQSTITWLAIQAGTSQADYSFDKSYTDIDDGTYAISITSGPGSQQVTIISVGRDRHNRETRALRVVYSNAIFGETAIYAGQGVTLGGGVKVQWGGVMSPYPIYTNNLNFPQYWSASQIIPQDQVANPPNCDSPGCVQWHSFEADLPEPPVIDFDFYRSSAARNMTGNCPAGGSPPGSCYYLSTATWTAGDCGGKNPGPVMSWDCTTTKGPIFFEGDMSIGGMTYNVGTVIVMGNLILPSGNWGGGPNNYPMNMPNTAWKQYGKDWAEYQPMDTAEPADFPGLNSTYTSGALTRPADKLAFNGFLYVGGNFNAGGGGGGNAEIYGVLYSVGGTTMTAASGVTFYYNGDAAANIVTTNISLTRYSWKDELRGWPSGL